MPSRTFWIAADGSFVRPAYSRAGSGGARPLSLGQTPGTVVAYAQADAEIGTERRTQSGTRASFNTVTAVSE